MQNRRRVLFAGASLAAACALGQTQPEARAPRFEVASIRPSKAADSTNRMSPTPQGGLRAENVTPLQLIALAYGVRPFLVVDAPGWASAERFDVLATPEAAQELPQPATPAQRDALRERLRRRVQALLADRFGLVVRTEKRSMPALKLVVAQGGHKMSPAAENESRRMQSNSTTIEGTAADMKMLADSISGLLGLPVVDATNLSGAFNLSIRFADVRPRPDPAADSGAVAAPAIFTALSEGLGLRLESGRTPIEVFVVLKLQRPSEN